MVLIPHGVILIKMNGEIRAVILLVAIAMSPLAHQTEELSADVRIKKNDETRKCQTIK